MIPPSIILRSPVLQVLHGEFDEEFLHSVSKISTCPKNMAQLLHLLSTYDGVSQGVFFQDLPFYADHKHNMHLIALYRIADYLCMPTEILEQIAQRCFAAFFLTDCWYEGFFTYYPLVKHFHKIWADCLEQFHNFHLYNNSSEYSTIINWENGEFVSFAPLGQYAAPDITYIRDVFLAGNNISRRIRRVEDTPCTLYDYISPPLETYTISDVFLQMVMIAPSQVQIYDEWYISKEMICDLKRYWVNEINRHMTGAHYNHCHCKECYNIHTMPYTHVSWEQHWELIDEQEEFDDLYEQHLIERVERWDW
jgi:hypothetical protein